MGLNAVRMVSQARPSISGPVLYRRAPVIWRRAHYLAVGLTCPVSAGLGGKAGHGPSFTWKASSAIAREDFSSTFIGIIKPPARQSQEYVGTRAQENQLFPVAASGVDFGNAQCPDCHSDAARSAPASQTRPHASRAMMLNHERRRHQRCFSPSPEDLKRRNKAADAGTRAAERG